MESVFQSLLILMVVIWSVAVVLRRLGIPTIMGELLLGVVLGPAVLGWIQPSEIIDILAEIGIFFLMLHAGVETEPREFFTALKRSTGVAIVGAIVPFSVSMGIGLLFGLDIVAALFVGLTMTATAVVITLKIFQELGLSQTPFARVIVASCVIDDFLALVVFGLVLGFINGEAVSTVDMLVTVGKVVLFFGVTVSFGIFVYPRLTYAFRNKQGKGFTFVLILGFAAGLFADLIGLHMILGAYIAGLFFEEKVADPNLIALVKDRLYAISYSFLGPIFFISLGFKITFDISTSGFLFLFTLTLAVIVGQIVSAGTMARRLGFTWAESLTVGVGMCGRAEMAFILAALGVSTGAIDNYVFSVLIFTSFLLNLATPTMVKLCTILLEREGSVHLAPVAQLEPEDLPAAYRDE